MSDLLKLELQIVVVLGTEPSSLEEQYKLLSSEASLQPPSRLPPASPQPPSSITPGQKCPFLPTNSHHHL